MLKQGNMKGLRRGKLMKSTIALHLRAFRTSFHHHIMNHRKLKKKNPEELRVSFLIIWCLSAASCLKIQSSRRGNRSAAALERPCHPCRPRGPLCERPGAGSCSLLSWCKNWCRPGHTGKSLLLPGPGTAERGWGEVRTLFCGDRWHKHEEIDSKESNWFTEPVKTHLKLTTALEQISWRVRGNLSSILWSKGFGWMNGFPNRSKFSRLSLRKWPGNTVNWLCAADRYLSLASLPMWNGKHASSLSSSFRLTSSRNWQNWAGRYCRRFWLRSRSWRVRCSVDRHSSTLKASRWLLWRTSSERQLRSPMVVGSFFMWLLLRSSLRRAGKTVAISAHYIICTALYCACFWLRFHHQKNVQWLESGNANNRQLIQSIKFVKTKGYLSGTAFACQHATACSRTPAAAPGSRGSWRWAGNPSWRLW